MAHDFWVYYMANKQTNLLLLLYLNCINTILECLNWLIFYNSDRCSIKFCRNFMLLYI